MDRRDRLAILAAGIYAGTCSSCVDDLDVRAIAKRAVELDEAITAEINAECLCGHNKDDHLRGQEGCLGGLCDCGEYVPA